MDESATARYREWGMGVSHEATEADEPWDLVLSVHLAEGRVSSSVPRLQPRSGVFRRGSFEGRSNDILNSLDLVHPVSGCQLRFDCRGHVGTLRSFE